ncbi:ferredoxin [Mycobacterium lentiflavum]|uniref:Ferredoxin n=1 Tax=Mycobacterium lentiflavum TaxID=141349 RepID=A0A0E4H2U2_MYCLN|nr:ferredoxin [Mycobacterium lentiflavum]CQD18106.1 ferredoxin [Mycobacterium lentiflavum]
MKVIVDTDRCELHGECTIAAPDVFEIEDDKEWVTVLDAQPGEDRRKAVEEAAMMCPVAAILIED